MTAPLTYEQAREIANHPDPAQRTLLAGRTDTPPEVLYFLASDENPAVRRAVAVNSATPAKGNLLLVDDDDEDVRSSLADKISHLGDAGSDRQRSITRDILHRLAEDQVVKVRAVIANVLKDMTDADPDVILRLARDSEIIVAAPILQYSPILSDDDLLELIRSSPIEGALAAISRRSYVDPRVTAAIVKSGNPRAVTQLLQNANANLQEDTLDALIDQAGENTEWQEPLVYRPELTAQSAQRLAEVVAAHLLDRMLARHDLPPEAVEAVTKVVHQRLQEQGPAEHGGVDLPPDVEARYAPFLARAREQLDKRQLDEMALTIALLADNTDDLVAGLAVRANAPVTAVLEIIAAQSPTAMTALAWAAKLTPDFAVELQARLAGIALSAILRPPPKGGYPMSEDEMSWQLEMYGCEAISA
ncbi:MAG TPA: DUF2336 domain-containing protein [Candidatus Sulfotelmatobacter sp.]|jgi:hypothetical protein|nr:DUF2336 domain-containing protein [Candidatus Sulfotelmatobacter sp.]